MSSYGYSNDKVEALSLNTLQVPFHSKQVKLFLLCCIKPMTLKEW